MDCVKRFPAKYLLLYFSVILFISFGLFLHLETVPHFWWDEGWTVSVARNWLELGHYGQVNNGILFPPGLSAHFPVVASVALSFKIFGVGVWQARLPGVLLTITSLLVLAYLATILYNRTVAFGAILLLVFQLIYLHTQPIIIGRQVLGEPLMIFSLLSGFILFFWALKGRWWLVFLAGCFWGIALMTKSQLQPFWIASILLPGIIALLKRWWSSFLLLGIGAFVAIVVWKFLLPWIQIMILQGNLIPNVPLEGSYQLFAFNLNRAIRLEAIRIVIIEGLFTVIGVGLVSWGLIRDLVDFEKDSNIELIRWALLGFVGSWMMWFLLFAFSTDRYFYPPKFVGSIFASFVLYKITFGFNFNLTFLQAKKLFSTHLRSMNIEASLLSIRSFLVIIWLTMFGLMNIIALLIYIIPLSTTSYPQVVDYADQIIPESALIETYESELFFGINRRFHFPPDQVSMDLVRRKYMDSSQVIEYDPLAVNPDYLIVGGFSNRLKLYDPWIKSGDFILVKEFPDYQIYRRKIY